MAKCKPKNDLPELGKIKKVTKEYIERMFKSFRTLSGAILDHYVDCPKCGNHRCLEFISSGIWRCLYTHCRFTFPEDLIPPSPAMLEACWKYQELMKGIRQIERQLKASGIKLP